MPKVLLIRHGQTAYNKKGILQGSLDVPLNDTGLEEAQAAAEYLRTRHNFDAVYTSTFQRAKVTGQKIAAAQGCPLFTAEAIQEINVGDWQGQRMADVQITQPELWQRLQSDRYHTRYPGGESFADVYIRATAWLQQVIEPQQDESLCIVSHGGAIRMLLAYALGIDPAALGRQLVLYNTGISSLAFDKTQNTWQVSAINCTAHLQ